ncbi:hypothetical protein [Egicoccus sp. AB-alg2]|uniref:THUMP-like domain-containing protein n=1 Tax=Egicoccus sp. AB-alg2 TaxID=3242693 RepID=UPI00359D5F95
MDTLDAATARWLVTDGTPHVDDVTAALDAGEAELAVVTRLRRTGLSPAASSAVVAAAVARRRARARWPQADRLLFTREGLEQASDPTVSDWRTRRLGSGAVWDLCAGLGGDAFAAAAHGAEVTAVDLDEARLVLLGHNARQLGLEVGTCCADALHVAVPDDAVFHADPGRRRDGRRVRRLAEHLPPVGALLAAQSHARGGGVVLSPAVDLADPDLPGDAELEFVQVEGELRESIVWTAALRTPGVGARATLLPSGVTRTRPADAPRTRLPVGAPGAVLLRVAPAAVRARLHDTIGAEVGARRLADARALLTLDEPPSPSPWYRASQIHAVLPVRPKAVRAWLRSVDVDEVEIATHGMEIDVAAWWRALGRPPRGPRGWRLEVVRTDAGGRVLVTRDGRTDGR